MAKSVNPPKKWTDHELKNAAHKRLASIREFVPSMSKNSKNIAEEKALKVLIENKNEILDDGKIKVGRDLIDVFEWDLRSSIYNDVERAVLDELGKNMHMDIKKYLGDKNE